MPQKPLDLPMQVAKAFIKDMRAYFAEPNAVRRCAIAAQQARLLAEYAPGRKLRQQDVVELFQEMKDHA